MREPENDVQYEITPDIVPADDGNAAEAELIVEDDTAADE